MIKRLDSDAYLTKMLRVERPGADKVLAFYEHRVGAICTDPTLMLLPLDDHLVHRGDGVFETLIWREGKMYQLEPHIKRMEHSASSIFLDPPCSWDSLGEIIMEVAREAGTDTGLIRVLLGRGPGGFSIEPYECPVSSLYVVAYAFTPKEESFFAKGVTAHRSSIPAKQPFMARIKSTDYLPNMLIKREAREKGYDYGLTFDDRNFLAEGATENVILVDRKGTIVVPELTNALRGTTLMRGIDLIMNEVPIQFRPVMEGEIYDAREFIIVSTTVNALSIVRYNDKPIHNVQPGPVSKRLRELLIKDHQEYGTPL